MKRLEVIARIKQLVRYSFVGLLSALIEYSFSNIIYICLSHGSSCASEMAAQNISSLLGIAAGGVVNYFMAAKFVFGADKNLKDFMRICMLTVVSCLITLGLTSMNVKHLKLPFSLFKIITMNIVFVWNYTGRRLWVYRKPNQCKQPRQYKQALQKL